MIAIYTGPAVSGIRPRRRAFRVEIDLPLTGRMSVAYHEEQVPVIEALAVDLKINGRVPSVQLPTKLRPDFETELIRQVYEIEDPITGKTISISGAAVALWIEKDYTERAIRDTEAPSPKGPNVAEVPDEA